MALIYQFAKLADAAVRISRVRCKPAFRRKIIVRVVAPVVIIAAYRSCILIRLIRLVDVQKIDDRHKLYVRNAEFFQIRNLFYKCFIRSGKGFYARIGTDGKIANGNFVDNCILALCKPNIWSVDFSGSFAFKIDDCRPARSAAFSVGAH